MTPGLYASSGGSPYLMGHMLNRMHTLGVMRCSPLGIVASHRRNGEFQFGRAFQNQRALPLVFLPPALRQLMELVSRMMKSHTAGKNGCLWWARRTEM